ncbi:MAG: AEC family transporter [Rhodospirillum sp.]|nr:AEC family transporter [Rhodospirillum sp.]MCF8489259.1 AEC family transporter [Rhodospirillum sp.]MCF8502709.1 AEC family transporter [Rhodospirillum sp.]
MTTIINTLVPLLLLIMGGQIMRRSGFLEAGFWSSAERLTYYILAPALLIRTIGGNPGGLLPVGNMVLAAYGAIAAAAGTIVLGYLVGLPRMGAPTFTSVFQGGVRFNTFIGLALADRLYGAEGVVATALVAGFMIIAINVLCVLAHALTTGQGKPSWTNLASELARNPLILSCLAGGLFARSGLSFPDWADTTLGMLSALTLPVALLCVGASLETRRFLGDMSPSLVASAVQFGLKPLTAGLIATALALPPMVSTVIVLLLATPTAPSGYILSRKMGGDHEAMASIIAFQTLVAFLTLPLTMIALGLT